MKKRLVVFDMMDVGKQPLEDYAIKSRVLLQRTTSENAKNLSIGVSYSPPHDTLDLSNLKLIKLVSVNTVVSASTR